MCVIPLPCKRNGGTSKFSPEAEKELKGFYVLRPKFGSKSVNVEVGRARNEALKNFAQKIFGVKKTKLLREERNSN